MSSAAVASPEYWRKCSSCKKEIGYKKTHFVCSVSTCTRKRTGYVFCTVHCWERHLPGARHRDAAAIEATSPSYEEWKAELAEAGPLVQNQAPNQIQNQTQAQVSSTTEARDPKRVIVRSPHGSSSASSQTPRQTSSQAMLKTDATRPPPASDEILVVVSKLKGYIRSQSDMNTSDSVMQFLSDHLRKICDRAINAARADGRKTVMDRDFKDLL